MAQCLVLELYAPPSLVNSYTIGNGTKIFPSASPIFSYHLKLVSIDFITCLLFDLIDIVKFNAPFGIARLWIIISASKIHGHTAGGRHTNSLTALIRVIYVFFIDIESNGGYISDISYAIIIFHLLHLHGWRQVAALIWCTSHCTYTFQHIMQTWWTTAENIIGHLEIGFHRLYFHRATAHCIIFCKYGERIDC